MRILLVEDDSHDVERVLRSFAEDNLIPRMNVEVVRDGQAALDLLFGGDPGHEPALENGRRPHLILLDLGLPQIGGLEVLRRVKSERRTRLIPVVIISGLRDERDIAESYELGVNSYIVKPTDDALFATVLRTMGLYWVRLNEPPSY